MNPLILVSILCVYLCAGLEYESETATCERSWVERHTFTKGATTPVPTENLRTNILLGKPVKVAITDGNYQESFLLDNMNMNGHVICGEAVDRMTSPITPDAEQQPIIVCTDGYVGYLNVSINRWDGSVEQTVWDVDNLSFKTRDITPGDSALMTLYLDGSSTSEHGNYIEAAQKCEMRGVMRDRGYTFTMDNFRLEPSTNEINAQSLSHISQSYTNSGGIMFRNRPYFWLSSWESTGLRDSARWTVGDVTRLKHTNDYVALQWVADSCWTVVYTHDKDGVRQKGSLDNLRMYIRMGHRVRVSFDGFNLEANSVYVSSDGSVMAQTSMEMARRRGTGRDKTFFNTKTRRVYRLIHHTGLIRSFYYFIENGQLSAKEAKKYPIVWSVDTRPWNPVVVSQFFGGPKVGDAHDLKNVLKSDTLRVKLEINEFNKPTGQPNSEMYLELNSVRTPDASAVTPEIVAQNLRTVPYYRGKDNHFNLRLYNPVSQYLEVSTLNGLKVAHFNMATREFKEFVDWPLESITWFKDGRI